MKRKKFFANLGNILITGLGVTFVCFALYSGATYWVVIYMDLHMTCYTPVVETIPIVLPTMSMLLFTSLLCSSDVVAAVSIVEYEAQP